MEPIKHHHLLCQGYRDCLTKAVTAIKEIIEKDLSELTETDITFLVGCRKQLDQ